MTAKVISVANQKGGAGKTTTAYNLACDIAKIRPEEKVLLIDMDPQGDATRSFGDINQESHVKHLFNGKTPKPTALTKNLALISSNRDLDRFEERGLDDLLDKFLEAFDVYKNNFNWIVMDNPPAVSKFLLTSLAVSDGLVIPAPAEKYAVDGLVNLLGSYKRIQKLFNPELRLLGVVFTHVKRRTVLHSDYMAMANDKLNEKSVFNVDIPDSIEVPEAVAQGYCVTDYAKNKSLKNTFTEFAKEVISRLNNKDLLEEVNGFALNALELLKRSSEAKELEGVE